MIEQLKFWQKKSKRKPPARHQQRPLANYKQPAYSYQKQERYRPRSQSTMMEVIFQPYEFNNFLALCYLGILFFVICFPAPLFIDAHWHPALDINQDGLFTITDVFYWCKWLYFVPGDVVVSAFMQFPELARFFEIHNGSYDGSGAFIMSMMYWWCMGGANLVIIWLIPILIQTYLR